jgi:hypothetical protein
MLLVLKNLLGQLKDNSWQTKQFKKDIPSVTSLKRLGPHCQKKNDRRRIKRKELVAARENNLFQTRREQRKLDVLHAVIVTVNPDMLTRGAIPL